jgi:dTDP-4-amino-4,6-dideoxygalactose transaminase
VSKNKDFIKKVQLIRNFGIENGSAVVNGMNGKMSEFHAAMGLALLGEPYWVERSCREAAKIYYDRSILDIPGIWRLSSLADPKEFTQSLQYYPIRVEKREKLFKSLLKQGVTTRKYFPLCSEFPFLETDNDLPVAKRLASEVLALPFFGGVDVVRVIEAIRKSI